MAIPFYEPIDLNQLEILNARLQNLGTDPGTPAVGQFWYITSDGTLRYRNGSETILLGKLNQITDPDGPVTMNSQKLTGLAAGTTAGDSVRFEQVIREDGSNPFTGDQSMGSNKLTSLAAGTDAADAIRKDQAVLVDGSQAFTGDQSMGSNKLTNLATPTADSDAANKGYVDSVATGLDFKDSVRAASTGNITLSAPGSTIDGVTMASGDRFLAKDQSTGSENGLYVWNGAASAATRAPDADSNDEVTAGLFVFVEEGSTNSDSGWVLTTDDPIVLDTTSLAFAQFSGAGQITAGAGLTKTGNTIDIVAADSSITVNADSITVGNVPITKGGTGATTAAGARTNLAVPGQFAADYGDGVATSIAIAHNLGSKDVTVQLYRKADDVKIEAGVVHTDTNTVTVTHAVAPTTNEFRAVIHVNQ